MTKRNWAEYNKSKERIASIDFYIDKYSMSEWLYKGSRKPGGKVIYSDVFIELIAVIREIYQLPYRQTVGLLSSFLRRLDCPIKVPNYTTIARRVRKLDISLRVRKLNSKNGLVIAVDSTGLSVLSKSDWHDKKHNSGRASGMDKYRKLHISIDVESGDILNASYSRANSNDCLHLPELIGNVDEKILSVCGDMAYDTVTCRKAIQEVGAKQLIPPNRCARVSTNNRNIRRYREVLKERDDAINYFHHNAINGDLGPARANWKKLVGYHQRSLVESAMFVIKSRTSDVLTNRREDSREVQAMIKCKAVNLTNLA